VLRHVARAVIMALPASLAFYAAVLLATSLTFFSNSPRESVFQAGAVYVWAIAGLALRIHYRTRQSSVIR
jgi:hypothetical protein